MKRYVPAGYSQTSDSFAALMVDAPDFPIHHEPLSEAFEDVRVGIDSVIKRSRSEQATCLLQYCKDQLLEIERVFIAESETNDLEICNATRHRLQRLYYDAFLKAGPLLKPGRRADDIGPDDDV